MSGYGFIQSYALALAVGFLLGFSPAVVLGGTFMMLVLRLTLIAVAMSRELES